MKNDYLFFVKKICLLILLQFTLISICVEAAVLPPENLSRGLIAIPADKGQIYLGWRLLSLDQKNVGFNVFRAKEAGGPYEGPLNSHLILKSTNFIDATAKAGSTYYYIVKTQDGEISNEVMVTAQAKGEQGMFIAKKEGGKISRIIVGDLTGDGNLDFIVSEALVPDYYIETYDGTTGNFLWRVKTGTPPKDVAGGAENLWWGPFTVWDLNGDGRAEVYTTSFDGELHDGFLVQLDGLTGQELNRVPWLAKKGIEDYDTNFLGIAIWNSHAHIIGGRGTQGTGLRLAAFDESLRQEWEWKTVEGEVMAGSAGHTMAIIDGDRDGNDEILWGSMLFDHDGNMRWCRAMFSNWHVDVNEMGDFDVERPGIEIYYADCVMAYGAGKKNGAGIYMVEWETGLGPYPSPWREKEALWCKAWDETAKRPYAHLHGGYAADVHPSIGIELVTWDDYQYVTGTFPKDQYPLNLPHPHFVMDVHGKHLFYTTEKKLAWGSPIQFDDDSLYELTSREDGLNIFKLNGPTLLEINGLRAMMGSQFGGQDIFGDFREECIAIAPDQEGFYVITNTTLSRRRQVSWLEDRAYREGQARLGTGYTKSIRAAGYGFGEIDPGNNKPRAVIEAEGKTIINNEIKVAKGEKIKLNAKNSKDSDGDNLKYYWEFGDGQSLSKLSAIHQYKKTGRYTVQLRISDR